jgi:hypothetical protein
LTRPRRQTTPKHILGWAASTCGAPFTPWPHIILTGPGSEPVDPILPEYFQGNWRLLEVRPGWHGNLTWDRFLVFAWGGSGQCLLVTAPCGLHGLRHPGGGARDISVEVVAVPVIFLFK